MDCTFIDSDVPGLVICPQCYRTLPASLSGASRNCKVLGVGDHMENIFRQLSVPKTAGCGCDAMIKEMNELGEEGCRRERGRLLEHLQTAYDSASLLTKGIAYLNAKRLKYPLSLDGLLDLAITRSQNQPPPSPA